MNIRYIQEMLGHAALSTTQIYTLVSVGKLKAFHTAAHPARFATEGQHPLGGDCEPGAFGPGQV